MKEQLEQYVKKVKERHEFCQGNEATTKGSLIAPLFTLLGWDMADPRECQPEYRADFGKGEKSATPVDWAFSVHPVYAFICEAKECGKKLKTYAEQLGMYFAKASVNLGVYSNGVHWQFYTDLDKPNIMDKAPFLSWDILNDDPIPFDFLALLQRSQFQPQLIKTFAEQGRRQNLLVQELTKLLDPPDADIIKLAIRNIESGRVTDKVVEQWKPILVSAIHEWAKIKVMGMVVQTGSEKRSKTESVEEEEEHGSEAGPKKVFKGKTCPKCGVGGLGFKLAVCACGHVFVFKKKETEDQQGQWYYAIDRQKLGPVPMKELKQLFASGRLKATDMVLQDGTTKWVAVSELLPADTLPFVAKEVV